MTESKAEYFIAGSPFSAPPLAAGLYVVSTPIGNLRDITVRALETLSAASIVLCEDTRTSAKLLDHYGIRGKRQPLHEHNERARAEEIVSRIAAGEAIALISDAGTPSSPILASPSSGPSPKPICPSSPSPAPPPSYPPWSSPASPQTPSPSTVSYRPNPAPALTPWKDTWIHVKHWSFTSLPAASTTPLPPWPKSLVIAKPPSASN